MLEQIYGLTVTIIFPEQCLVVLFLPMPIQRDLFESAAYIVNSFLQHDVGVFAGNIPDEESTLEVLQPQMIKQTTGKEFQAGDILLRECILRAASSRSSATCNM